MMPLIYAEKGQSQIIKKIGGNPEVKKHLTELDWEAIAALAKTALDDIGPKQG